MGRDHTPAEIARMIKSVDRDGNGKISIDEFAELLG
jgi:Ca2+-binding EF-hand superfamily protein